MNIGLKLPISLTKLAKQTKRFNPKHGIYYKCKYCTYIFKKFTYLEKHIRTRHLSLNQYQETKPNSIIKCEICQFECQSNYVLRNHARIYHVDEYNFKCHECSYNTKNEMDLKQHISIIHQRSCKSVTLKRNNKSRDVQRDLIDERQTINEVSESSDDSNCNIVTNKLSSSLKRNKTPKVSHIDHQYALRTNSVNNEPQDTLISQPEVSQPEVPQLSILIDGKTHTIPILDLKFVENIHLQANINLNQIGTQSEEIITAQDVSELSLSKNFNHDNKISPNLDFNESKTIQNSNYSFSCNKCKSSFKSELLRQRHLIWHRLKIKSSDRLNIKTIFKCRKCRLTFKNKLFLQTHKAWHRAKKVKLLSAKYFCLKCMVTFSSRLDRKRHKPIHNVSCSVVIQRLPKLEVNLKKECVDNYWNKRLKSDFDPPLNTLDTYLVPDMKVDDLLDNNSVLNNPNLVLESVPDVVDLQIPIFDANLIDNDDIWIEKEVPRPKPVVLDTITVDECDSDNDINQKHFITNIEPISSDSDCVKLSTNERNIDRYLVPEIRFLREGRTMVKRHCIERKKGYKEKNDVMTLPEIPSMISISEIPSTEQITDSELLNVVNVDSSNSDSDDSLKNYGPSSYPIESTVQLLTSLKIYRCDNCHFQSGQKFAFKKHRKLHSVKRKYVCDQCGFRFKRKLRLSQHRLSHASSDCDEIG